MPLVTPVNPQVEAARFTARFRNDPEGYVDNVFPWGVAGTKLADRTGPRAWQREILQDFGERLRARDVDQLRRDGEGIRAIKYSVVSGHGSGKSAFLSWIALFLFDTRPHSIGSMTSNTKQQMKGRFFSELSKWLKLSKLGQFGQIVMGDSPRLQRIGSEATWKLEGYAPRKELSEGFAGQHAMDSASYYIFDEASKIDDSFYEVALGGTMDSEPFMFACGNGTQPQGFFYNSHHPTKEDRDHPERGWITRSINSLDVEGINKEEIEEIIRQFGPESDQVRVRVKGMFPQVGEDQFFATDLIERCLAMPEPRDNDYAPFVMGVDVARQGTDKSVICIRKGRNARNATGEYRTSWMAWDKNSLTQLCEEIAHSCMKLAQRGTPVKSVFVEGIGVGEGVIDTLRRMHVPNIVEVKTGSTKTSLKGVFNKRAEMYVNLRKAMQEGLALPDEDRLRIDLNNIEYGFKESGELYMQSKKEMKAKGRMSCDFTDALALTFCDNAFTMDTPYGLMHARNEMHMNNQGRDSGRQRFRDWAMQRGI